MDEQHRNINKESEQKSEVAESTSGKQSYYFAIDTFSYPCPMFRKSIFIEKKICVQCQLKYQRESHLSSQIAV